MLLFYSPQMEGMAKRIARVAQCVQLCTVSWTRDERDEGFRILNIEDGWRVPGSICFFLASFDSTACLYEQFAVISKLPRLGAKVLKVILPFFPSLTLRAEGGERGKGREGEIPLSRTLARLLSAIPNAKAGPTELLMFDIHHLQERFYFDDNTVPRLESSMTLLSNRLDDIIEQQVLGANASGGNGSRGSEASGEGQFPWDEDSQNEIQRLQSLGQLTMEESKMLRKIKGARRKSAPDAFMIAFADEKTAKRFGKSFPGFEHVICTRMLKNNGVKEGGDGMILLEGQPNGRRCVLVDDVIITGTTMLQCARLLKQLGAKSVWVYATHGQFSQESWKRFNTGLLEKVIITDSCPLMAEELMKVGAPFEIMPLHPLIAPLLDEEAFVAAHHAQMYRRVGSVGALPRSRL